MMAVAVMTTDAQPTTTAPPPLPSCGPFEPLPILDPPGHDDTNAATAASPITSTLTPSLHLRFPAPRDMLLVTVTGMGFETFSEPQEVLLMSLMEEHRIVAYFLANRTLVNLVGRKGVMGTTDGSRATATFNRPYGLAVVESPCAEPSMSAGATAAPERSVYLIVGEDGGACLRHISLWTLEVITIAGKCGHRGNADGTGDDARFGITGMDHVRLGQLSGYGLAGGVGRLWTMYDNARLNNPSASDTPSGTTVSLLAVDSGNNVIRRVTLNGPRFDEPAAVTTLFIPDGLLKDRFVVGVVPVRVQATSLTVMYVTMATVDLALHHKARNLRG